MRIPVTTIAALIALTLAATGCTRTYTVSTEMQPSNVMTVFVDGSAPFVMVNNEGPGRIDVTFDVGHDAEDGPNPITPGSSSGRTLGGTNQVRITTGPDEGAEVRVEALRAEGMEIGPPRPR